MRLEFDGRKSLFMASEVRCGSTYVAETLAYELQQSFGFELWDIAQERFAEIDMRTTADEVLSLWRSLFLDRSGFVACKLMCKSLSHLHRLAAVSPAVREAFFGDFAHWVVVRRRDRLEQAVSLAVARKTGAFHHYGDAQEPEAQPSVEELDQALKAVAMSDIYLQTFESSLPAQRVVPIYYRDFVANEIDYVNRVHRMCGFPDARPDRYASGSKLKRVAQTAKGSGKARLRDWFLANYV